MQLNTARFNVGLGWFSLIFCISVLDLPMRFFLKDSLGLTASAIAMFFAIANIPTYAKPVYGFFTDSIRLFGTRRRAYLIITIPICCVLYVVLGFARNRGEALGFYLFITFFLAILSIILGAIIVEYGKKYQITGGLSSLRLAVTKVAVLIAGPIGGYLATKDLLVCTSICAIILASLLCVYLFSFKEKRIPVELTHIRRDIRKQFRTLVHSRVLWMAGLLVFLWKIEPGFNTPLLFYQTNVLQFNASFIGLLYSMFAAAGVLGALIYGYACKRINLRMLIILGIIIDALDSLIYLAYAGQLSAIIITTLNGMTAMLCILPLYDLAARATPTGSESLGYALLLSVWNLADAISDLFGSKLYDFFDLSFTDLVWVNAITTAAIILLVPFIPRGITNSTDSK